VQSGCAASNPSTVSRCAESFGGLGLPIGRGANRPLDRNSSIQRCAVRTAISNRAAAPRSLIPFSIARTTRSRRSGDKGAAIHAGLLDPALSLNHTLPSKGIHFRL
jgi:hypothetical protein